MREKLIIDLFAGGGGASTGIEMALGRSPDVAINHDPVAIAMHAVNHPGTEHYCNDIWAVDPDKVRPGEPVGLLWASPDCKHFSKAKGGKPKERNIRDLAWVIVDWAEKRKPDVIIVENVEEFRTWGPIDNEGNVIREFSGQTFEDWLKRLRKAGYRVEWRESRAWPYGAPTIRKRLCIIASRIGKPVWPKPTFGEPTSKEVTSGKLAPWRTAAEHVIDWSIACPSIFDTKQVIWEKHGLRAVRPLAHNTGARVARGIRRYVLDAARPFLVSIAHGDSGGRREYPVDEPFHTVTVGGVQHAVVAPSITRFNGGVTGSAIDEPLGAVTANSFIKRPGGAAPLGVLAPVLTYAQQGGANRPADGPMHTVTASAKDQNAVIVPVLTGCGGRAGQSRPRSGDEPMATITAKADVCAVAPHLMTMRNAGKPFSAADEPTHTVTAGGAGLTCVSAFLAQHNNDARRVGGVNPGRPADEPISTVTASGAQQGVVAAHVMRQFGASVGHAADAPTGSVTAGVNKTALVTGALVKYYGTGDGQDLCEPLHTVTVKDRFGLAEASMIAPPFGPEHKGRAREVAEFLRFHGVWDGGEFVTLEIGGATFVIADIGLRMLTPRELFNAQGFPPDYRIDRDADGNVFSKSNQVGRAGNSVSPPWAAAHVAANCAHLRVEPVAMEAAE